MPSKKPTLILVHGAWHDPSSFDQVVEPLRSEGYRCITPGLMQVGELADFMTKEDDASMVQIVVERVLDQGEDVVMIGHSLGSFVACSALESSLGEHAKGGPGRGKILGLLMIAGFIPPVYFKGAFADVKLLDLNWCAFDPEQHTSHMPLWPERTFYNDLPEQLATRHISKLRRNHVPTLAPSFEAWRYVPTWYLTCSKDQCLPIDFQESMIRAAKTEGGVLHVTNLDSGHCPTLSQPENVVNWIRKSVEVEMSNSRDGV